MEKYLVISILTILARKAELETKKLFLQNHFGLYDNRNHIVKSEHNFNIKLKGKAENKDLLGVGEAEEGNTNAYLGYEEVAVTPVRFREKKPISPTEILASVAGVDKKEQAKAVMETIKAEMTELFEVANFGHEIIIARCLQNAILKYNVKINGANVEKQVDLKSPAGHIVNYTATPAKTVLSVIKEGQKKVGKLYKADTLILGSNKVEKFLEEVKEKLNTRHIEGITQKLNGFEIGAYRYLGYYDGMDVYEYNADYKSGVDTKPLIGENNIIVTSTQMKWKRYYGAILDSDAIEKNQHIGKAFSKSWNVKDPSITWLLIESDAITAPLDASGIYCATMAA